MGTLSFGADEPRPAALLAFDPDSRVVLADALAAELFACPVGTLVGQTLAGLLAPPDQEPSARGLIAAEPGTVATTPFRRPDGSVFTATAARSALTGPDGTLVSLSLRAATELGAAQSWLAGIVRSARDAIIGESLDGRVTSWNAAAAHLYGYSEEEMLGRRMAELYAPESRNEESDILRRISEGQSVEIYEAQRLHRDGHRMTVELSVSPVTDASGRIVGAARVSRDVTARHRDEAKFRWLLDATALAIIGVDRYGLIQLVNSEAQRLFGYRLDELRGQPVELLLPESVRTRHRQHRSVYATDPRMRRMGEGLQLRACRRDGSEFPAEISLASIQTDEGLLVAATVHDISARIEQEAEHRRLENELQRSQRLDSLGQLAGGVAHDFNNVLAIISTHASILEEDLEEIASSTPALDGAHEAVAQVLAASERGARLTRQLLAFGRREIVRPEVFDLNDVVYDVQRMLTGTLGADVVLGADLAGRPAAVSADPGRIEQVLVNLAVNARDAMPAGGSLTVRTDHTVLGPIEAGEYGLERGSYVRLQVTDTGTGMPPEVAERAFEPFFSTKAAEGHGTGLGLASVYGIVAQAGGAISLDSEVGIGTTVTILLPSAELVETGDRPDTVQLEPARPGYGTILLVDDERELRASIETILTRVGYLVLSAATGAEAVELAASFPGRLDLLLTDITMPGLSGREVADQVRSTHPSIQVLYMSGFAQRLLTSKGTIDPEVTLIEKPFNRRDLLTAIEETLRLPV
ncbi:PAS domain S-box protein [Cryptosporangium sp. NPDC051539]|uniref:PAS domain S-box protein n=1 Tax=Cryptosporangium sp. NPDC051539 TaxID=3363962 RepID=UPI0037B9F60E